MPEIQLYKSPWKALKMLALATPFIAFSLYAIITRSTEMPIGFAWVSLCFFGMAIPIALFNLFDRRPQIIINETGLFDRTAYKDFINWNLIMDAYTAHVNSEKFICLVLAPEAIPLLKGNVKMKQLSKSMGFQEINLYLGQVKNIDEFKFIEFIKQMTVAEPTHRQKLLTTNLYE